MAKKIAMFHTLWGVVENVDLDEARKADTEWRLTILEEDISKYFPDIDNEILLTRNTIICTVETIPDKAPKEFLKLTHKFIAKDALAQVTKQVLVFNFKLVSLPSKYSIHLHQHKFVKVFIVTCNQNQLETS